MMQEPLFSPTKTVYVVPGPLRTLSCCGNTQTFNPFGVNKGVGVSLGVDSSVWVGTGSSVSVGLAIAVWVGGTLAVTVVVAGAGLAHAVSKTIHSIEIRKDFIRHTPSIE
jgi:hypothetical protein